MCQRPNLQIDGEVYYPNHQYQWANRTHPNKIIIHYIDESIHRHIGTAKTSVLLRDTVIKNHTSFHYLIDGVTGKLYEGVSVRDIAFGYGQFEANKPFRPQTNPSLPINNSQPFNRNSDAIHIGVFQGIELKTSHSCSVSTSFIDITENRLVQLLARLRWDFNEIYINYDYWLTDSEDTYQPKISWLLCQISNYCEPEEFPSVSSLPLYPSNLPLQGLNIVVENSQGQKFSLPISRVISNV